ncbi:OprD family porin [Pantoea sp. Ap-967]|uniref:OprD family porin n=1 Tax=Pantoea sp. Ap-967 TaxID=2608362 RepID=UPI00142154A1|nr:OprD family porin [Pantoea sp. Ap-967]NIE73280.1 OprD family porin [Pantoea sp. Ap-967]
MNLSRTTFYVAHGACLLIAQSAMAEHNILGSDASVKLNLRNYYINDNFVGDRATQGKAQEWTQSFILDAQSGYTPGLIGFGVDSLGMYAQKLDGGGGTSGTQLLPRHDDGEPADNFGRLAVALKARVGETQLRVGELLPSTPVLSYDGGRALPQTFRGVQIESHDFSKVGLYAGQMRANSPRDDASMEKMWLNGRPDATSDRFDYAGVLYTTTDQRSQVGLWGAQLKDIYRQQYLNLRHTLPLGDWRFSLNAGLFHGSDAGSAKAGELENTTWFTQFSLNHGGHTLLLGLQRVGGETGWMRVNGSGGGELGNDSFNSSYENARERSWQVRHDYNFVVMGFPGLTLMNRYLHGDHIDLGDGEQGKEWGRETELGYVVQSGSLQGMDIRWRNSSMRRTYGSGSFDENLLVVNYAFSTL